MRKNSKVILVAEEQLVFGRSLPESRCEGESEDRASGLPLAGTAG